MNTGRLNLIPTSLTRWLTAAGVTLGLMIPLSASADQRGNGAAEVLVSAAVAYAVIDAAGGFKDHKHRHRHASHRHYRSKYRYDRRYWSSHGHRRHHAKHRHHDRDWRHHDGYRRDYRHRR